VVGRFGTQAGRARALSSVAALALLVAGCSGTLPVDRQVFLPTPPMQAEERPAVQREHARILAAYGGPYDDAKLEAEINETIEKLVASSERPDLHYKTTILNSPAVNAFALPTGQLYVTRGLLALANDKSELASVLAHEMAHVVARHAAIREDQARQAAIVNRVATDVIGDPQMGALALAKSEIAMKSFSRAQEFEADGIGVGISSRAGFDPYGATRFLTSMGRNSELKSARSDPHTLDFLSSHPETRERVKNATLNARQFTAPGPGEREKPNYLQSIDGLVYGEDPSQGFVRGRRFLHPRLGFTFVAPDGFGLDNTAQAVFGVKDGGMEALRLDVVTVPAEQKLAEYLTSGWIENIDAGSIDNLTINGLPAATATAKGDQWSFRLYAIRFGSEVYRFIFAAKERTPEVDKTFRDALNSFRRMTLAEQQAAKPLRLKIVRVGPHDTVERLAEKMATGDRPAERFRVLNGLDLREKLKPGDYVKIVTE
jgi:predicted Zn-dependent protease